MTESASPFDGGPFMYEADWSKLWSQTLADGIVGRSAVNLSTTALQAYSDQDGRQVKVRPGAAVIRGHYYASDQTKVVALSPNTATGWRQDLIVLRLDTLARSIAIGTVEGAGDSGVTVPTLTQQVGGIWEIPLATVNSLPGYTTVPPVSVGDRRSYVAGVGLNEWLDYTPQLVQGGTGPVPLLHANAENHARYQVVGSRCRVSWRALVSCTGTPNFDYQIGLPIPSRYKGVTGTATLQNLNGSVFAVPLSAGNSNLSSTTYGLVSIRTYDLRNLNTSGGSGTFDSFDIEYEIA